MTDRYYALTVILEKDIREDYVDQILNSIKMIKGVQSVEGGLADPTSWMAEERARIEIGKKLMEIVYPIN